MDKVLFAKVSEELHREVKLHVAATGITMSQFMQRLVEQELKKAKETNASSLPTSR